MQSKRTLERLERNSRIDELCRTRTLLRKMARMRVDAMGVGECCSMNYHNTSTLQAVIDEVNKRLRVLRSEARR